MRVWGADDVVLTGRTAITILERGRNSAQPPAKRWLCVLPMQYLGKARANCGGGGHGRTDGRNHRRTVLRFRTGQRPCSSSPREAPRALSELIRWQRSRLHRLDSNSVLPVGWGGAGAVASIMLRRSLTADVTNCSFYIVRISFKWTSRTCPRGLRGST